MKFVIKTFTLSALLIVSAAGHAENAKGGHMQHNMSGMDASQMTDRMQEMQSHMLMMHDLSNRILAETNAKKKQALKNQQLELMKAHHMQMMGSHHAQQPAEKKMEHDMAGMNMDPAKMAEKMKQKQEHMLMMHEMSNKILAEKDSKKQQTLKDQQLEMMKAHHSHSMKH